MTTIENEPMPTSVADYNNHPLYVDFTWSILLLWDLSLLLFKRYALEKHLKKYEIIHPKEPVIGIINGESIYPRHNVKQVRIE
jgi:xeroderma pigmentosum group C-complementing protein